MNTYHILPLVAATFCLILIVLVLRRNYKSSAHRIFFCFLLSMGLWGFIIFGMRASPDLEYALPWDRAVAPAVAFTAVFYYHFTLAYTNIKPRIRGLLHTAYAFAFLVLAFAPTELLVTGMQLKPYGYAPVLGPAFFPFFIGTYIFVTLGIVNLARAYKLSHLYEARNRYLYLIIATIISLVGGAFDILPTLGLPLYPGAIIGNIIFCLLTSVAVLKYHLLDIHIVVRKGTAYLLMSTMVAMLYVGAIFLFHAIFEEIIPVWAYFIFILLLALVLQPLWHRVQRFVNRWFYRERYDFLSELEYFSREAHDISDPKQLGSSLVKLIGRALQTSSVHLLLLSQSGDFTVISSTGKNTAQLTLKSRSPLLRWLRSSKGLLYHQDLDIIPQLQSLTVKEKKELENIGVELFVPLKTKKIELVGLVLLGKKLSQQPYSEEDERLVLTVASRVAIELENARLYTLETTMRKELQRQDEQKTEFLHSVAHELKTPLTAIISSSELIGTEMSSTTLSQRQRLARNISRSAWLMERRVAELLDLAKMQLGDLQLKLEPLEIGVIIEEVTSQLIPLFKNKGQSLKLEIPGCLSPVKADREKIEQVLLNLLSNANKFSPTGGNIMLRAKEVDDRIVVEVKDSAPVITEEEKEKLFEPYYRGGDADVRERIPGLGLGLAISKKLVELHQGKIWVESEPGKGNSFIFSIPTRNREQRGLDHSSLAPQDRR